MPLLPVSANRTSTPLNNQRLLLQLNSDQLAIQRNYDQLSTGRRISRISDDPAAATRAIGLQRGISHSEQLLRNANSTEAFYQSTDAALDRVDGALIEARGVAVEAAQGILSDDQREALAITIRQSMDSIVSAGNAMFSDHKLLGGVLENGAALEHLNGSVLFSGSEAVGQTKVGSGTDSKFTVTGASAIGVGGVFEVGEPLDASITSDTRLVDLRGGLGVRSGVIRVSDGAEEITLDLQSAATIGDVVDVLRNTSLGGRAIGVTLGGDSISIQYADGLPGTLAIEDAPGSNLASDLGVENANGLRPPPLIGDRLAPQVTRATPISELNGGTGLDLSDGLVIDQGSQRFVVDFDGAENLGDVLIAINRSGADVHAQLDQSRGRIELKALRSGVDYSIGENGGDTASQLGIRTATTDTLLSDIGRGVGLNLNETGPDLNITRPDGTVLALDLNGADTIEDVMDLILNHPDNQDTRRLAVTLNAVGNGLQLSAPPGAQQIEVANIGVSDAGVRLGWIPKGDASGVGETVGSTSVLAGTDFEPRAAGGAIDTLLRLETAVRDGDISEIGRLQSQLDNNLDTSSRTRGRIGVWSQNLDELRSATQDENVLLQSQLSDAVDADLATVISELNARQASLEASMRFIGQISNLTVLNFI